MLYDSFHRPIHYLRVSVTDRCNLRCVYCMPEEGVPTIPHEKILSLEKIAQAVETAAGLGFDKVRLTGGEPLVRRGIVDLVKMLSGIPGIKDLAMTTNGVLLSEYAQDLKHAGLHRVNVSLDSLDPQKYHEITRWGKLRDVLDGIHAARTAGLSPIKINTVLLRGEDRSEAERVSEYARSHGYQIRFIRQMDLQAGEFWEVEGGDGGKCYKCNRLRLSSQGIIYPCLFSDRGFDISQLGIEEAIRTAVNQKPERGAMSRQNTFYGLGG